MMEKKKLCLALSKCYEWKCEMMYVDEIMEITNGIKEFCHMLYVYGMILIKLWMALKFRDKLLRLH